MSDVVIPFEQTIHLGEKGRHDLFVTACEALWGEDFAGRAAIAFGINYRNMRRMKRGEMPIPKGVLNDLATQLQDEQERLGTLVEILRTVGAQS